MALVTTPGAVELVTRLRAPAGEVHLRLANDIAVVAAALPLLQAFSASQSLPARVANRLEVVFEELVSNPIRHGFRPHSDQSLHIWLARLATTVRLEIEDDGMAFDPLARAAPPPLGDLANAPEGGLGIALVRRLASHFARELPPRQPGMVNRLVVELPLI